MLQLAKDGKFSEMYNGPGKPVWEARGAESKNGQCRISLARLKSLMSGVSPEDRIPMA